jgi:hypothetical protein
VIKPEWFMCGDCDRFFDKEDTPRLSQARKKMLWSLPYKVPAQMANAD